MNENDQIPLNDDTRPSADIVNFAREHNKRRLRNINDADLERAIRNQRPAIGAEE